MTRQILIAVLLIAAMCAPACTKNKIWQSVPAQQTLSGRSYDVDFEPLKKDTDFFNWFRLTVRNKTDRDMEIDWNRTRYIHNGKDAGLFVFEGVVPAAVKTATIPGAVIPGGETFTRDICSFQTHRVYPPARADHRYRAQQYSRRTDSRGCKRDFPGYSPKRKKRPR